MIYWIGMIYYCPDSCQGEWLDETETTPDGQSNKCGTLEVNHKDRLFERKENNCQQDLHFICERGNKIFFGFNYQKPLFTEEAVLTITVI